jgi:hypothetical protein
VQNHLECLLQREAARDVFASRGLGYPFAAIESIPASEVQDEAQRAHEVMQAKDTAKRHIAPIVGNIGCV